MASNFDLPSKLEKFLGVTVELCKRNGEKDIVRVIVNSDYVVTEEWTFDNWNGGTYGHAITFQVPAEIYYQVFDDLEKVAENIGERLNKLSNVPNEHIAAVFLELKDDPILERWREKSGELILNNSSLLKTGEIHLDKLWHPGFLRMFITHKSEIKEQAVFIKGVFESYGVSCFVAHEDIEPTRDWQEEIEKALHSMDVQLALMTSGFANSNWTDQEIGVAIGRGVPIISIRLGMDPYGFIGKYQGVAGKGKSIVVLAKEVYGLLWANSSLKNKLKESLILRFERSSSFDHANTLMEYLEKIDTLTPDLIERLENSPKMNRQVRDAHKVEKGLKQLIKKLRK